MVGVIAPQAPRFCTTISFCRRRRRKKSILNRRRRRKFCYIGVFWGKIEVISPPKSGPLGGKFLLPPQNPNPWGGNYFLLPPQLGGEKRSPDKSAGTPSISGIRRAKFTSDTCHFSGNSRYVNRWEDTCTESVFKIWSAILILNRILVHFSMDTCIHAFIMVTSYT